MKRLGSAFVLFIVAVIAAPADAQEQTGVLTGRVTADGGEALPGVSVEIRGPSGTLVSVTDARGDYRFPRVIPGVHTVTARLQGFQTFEASRVPVSLGDRAILNVTLGISSVTETVVVTGERVQIAVGESSTSASMAAEQIALLPKGRDFTSVVAQAPGAANEAFAGGISIDGASGSENRFVIDGIDTTRPNDGLSGQSFITDFVEEIQVKSAGYAAEFGGSLGGVINAITKSGTNELHGWLGGYLSSSSLNGDRRPVAYESWKGFSRTFEKDDESRFEPGVALGGPILKDSLWFYLGYSPTLRSIERTPYEKTTAAKQDITDHFFAGNLKGNIGSRLVFKLSANVTPSETDGNLPALDGSTPDDADLDVVSKYPTSSTSAYADFVPSSSFYVSGRVGMYETDTKTSGIDTQNQIFFRNGVIGTTPENPGGLPKTDPRYRETGFSNVPNESFQNADRDNWKRTSAGIDANLFVTALGSHSLKAGIQYEKIENSVHLGENGNFFEVRWGLPDWYGMGVQGTYGSVGVRRFRTEGAAEASNVGLFLQDTWNVHPNLTLNVGLRTEQERVPNYAARVDPTLPKNAIEFDFEDKLAPRLGFSWDVTGRQQLKVYGSYGTYYDITKLEMPRGSFGAEHWVQHMYELNTLDWDTLFAACTRVDNTLGQNPCPTLPGHKARDLRAAGDPRDSIDPDLRPMENEEVQIGVDYQLTKSSVVSARYVNKKLRNTIEDIGYLVFLPDGTSAEQYISGNPGKGIVSGDPAGPIPPQAEAIRDYEAIELTFSRRFADSFSVRAAYVYSRLSGNYSGLASSDEFGRTDPNVARYFDGLVYGYDSRGELVDGVLNTDRPHAFEVQGLYQASWGTNIGLSFSWVSGSPVSTDGSYNGVTFFPNGRNDMGRLSGLTQTDLLLTHPFRIGGYDLEVSLNVLNLFDQDTVTRIDNVQYFDGICDVRADCDGSNGWYFTNLVPYDYETVMEEAKARKNPLYGSPLAYQDPRTVRLGLRFVF